jgi:hypothetical protein
MVTLFKRSNQRFTHVETGWNATLESYPTPTRIVQAKYIERNAGDKRCSKRRLGAHTITWMLF